MFNWLLIWFEQLQPTRNRFAPLYALINVCVFVSRDKTSHLGEVTLARFSNRTGCDPTADLQAEGEDSAAQWRRARQALPPAERLAPQRGSTSVVFLQLRGGSLRCRSWDTSVTRAMAPAPRSFRMLHGPQFITTDNILTTKTQLKTKMLESATLV